MPYRFDAVLGRFDVLGWRTAGIREAVVAPLRQGMGLVPLTERLLAETPPDFGRWARGGAVAHVEADFPGGVGHRSASVWRDGAQVWGPVRTGTSPVRGRSGRSTPCSR